MDNLLLTIQQFRLQDLFDILLVWALVYRVLILAKRSGAVQILSGIGFLAIAYLGSIWFELITFNWILDKFFSNLFLITVILFQAEIRRALAQIGSNPFFTGVSVAEEAHIIDELSKGVIQIAQKGYGGLIVVERDIGLDYFLEMGLEFDSSVRAEVLVSIFIPDSPIHDGAVLIKSGRIMAAGCFLPLSKNSALDKNLGTRHRAAIGLAEETDAFIIVISEENNSVGFVQGGLLTPDISHKELRQKLSDIFGVKQRNLERKHI
ncbi:MAG: TIGR00159 family protein [Bdellovibrionaceae bacterium]|jgi:diadenylate cyclase|nr:TIGR00159 family protein [Pseudobdellovibrionaceae bacterium]